MRVLQIVDNLKVNSGVSTIIMGLYRNINRNDIQFDFLVMRKSATSYENEIRRLGGAVFYINNPLSIKTCLSSLIQSNDFFYAHAKKYEIVHLHSPTTIFFNLRYAKKYGIKHRIVHSHSSMFSTKKLVSIVDHILCLNLKSYANHFWACSTEAAVFLFGDSRFNNHKVEIVNNAIDSSKYAFNKDMRIKTRKKLGVGNNIVVGHVASFNKIKNQEFTIKVFSEVLKENTQMMLVFIGDGATLERCQALTKKYGLEEHIYFCGFKKNVNEYLQAFDILVLPSIKEGLPLTVVEAQAAGLPCYIGSSITKEVDLGGVNFLPLDVQIWKKKLVKFILYKDKIRIQNSTRFAESKFNIINEAKRLSRLYTELSL